MPQDKPQLTARKALLNVILTNSSNISPRRNNNVLEKVIINSEEQKIIKEKVHRMSWKLPALIIGGTLISLYSGILYLDSGKAAGEKIQDQIEELLKELGATAETVGVYLGEIVSWLIHYCGVAVNSLLNTQTTVMLIMLAYKQKTRNEARRVLEGNINKFTWFLGSFAALGPMITPFYLDSMNAQTKADQLNAVLSALSNYPPNILGGYTFFAKSSRFFANWTKKDPFSPTIDDTVDQYTREEVLLFREIRNILAAGPTNFSSYVLHQYILHQLKKKGDQNIAEGKQEEDEPLISNNFEKILNKYKDYKAVLEDPNAALNSKNQAELELYELIYQNHNTLNITLRATCDLVKELVEKAAKGTVSVFIVGGAVALLANVALSSYYAGKSLSKSDFGIVLGALSAALTAVPLTGLLSFSLKDILGALWRKDVNYLKSVAPQAYYPLAIVLTIIGSFSGGLVALAGLTQFQRLLSNVPELKSWVPQVMEVFGFLGGVEFNTPFCLGLGQWFMELFLTQYSKDPNLKDSMALLGACRGTAQTLFDTKVGNIESLVNEKIFPPYLLSEELLNKVDEVKVRSKFKSKSESEFKSESGSESDNDDGYSSSDSIGSITHENSTKLN